MHASRWTKRKKKPNTHTRKKKTTILYKTISSFPPLALPSPFIFVPLTLSQFVMALLHATERKKKKKPNKKKTKNIVLKTGEHISSPAAPRKLHLAKYPSCKTHP
jgi:hypothetical protein